MFKRGSYDKQIIEAISQKKSGTCDELKNVLSALEQDYSKDSVVENFIK